MIQNQEVPQQQESRPRSLAESILVPPKTDKKGNETHGKFYIDRVTGSGKIVVTPASDWNEIHDFDDAHKVTVKSKNPETQKAEKKSIPLSDLFLENPASLVQLAFENKFITQKDLDVEVPVISADENGNKVFEYDRKTGKPLVSRPFSFIRIEGDRLVLPKNLTARQIESTLLLVFSKTVNTDDFSERKQPNGLNKLLIEELTLDYTTKLKDAGEVINDPNNPNPLFTEEPILQALNIACRKAIEARLKEDAYRKTQISRRKGETVEENLLSRLSIAAGIGDETKRHGAKKEIEKLMHVRTPKEAGKQTELEYSASIDLFMAQAFDVLIPADVRLQMKKDQMEADATLDHLSRADKIEKIQREKQVWRMAILKYFQVERNFPGKLKIPTIAQESEDTNIFTPDEVNRIDDYRKIIGDQIDALDSVGGFNKLDLSSVNLIKTKQLLEKLVTRNKGEQNKSYSKRIEDALVGIFSKCADLAADAKRKPDEARKLIDKSGLLKGLKGEERELVFKILTEAFGAQMSLELRLTQSTKEKIGAQVKPTDIKLGTNLNEGMKGMDFLYRRGKEEQIDKKDRYKLLSEKGKANFAIKTDKQKGEHIVALGGEFSDEEYQKAEAAMNQTPIAKKTTVEPAPTPVVEVTQTTQKEKDSRSVELAALLNIPDVNNYEEFRKNIEDRFGIVAPDEVGNGTHIEYEIPTLELTDAVGLESLSHLAELFPDNKIRIVSLGLTVEEGKKIQSVINGMEISTLVLSGSEAGDNINQITFEDSTVSVVEVTQGKFVITTAKEPDLIRMNNGNGKEKIIDLVLTSERSLNSSLDTQTHGGTIFQIDSSGSVIVDLHRSATDKVIIYSDLETGDTWSNSEKIVGENVLVFENGVYKLKQIPEAAEPSNPSKLLEEEPAATPLGEFKPLPPEEVAQMEPDVKLKYHQAELRSNEGSSQKRKAVGEILQILSESGVDVSELQAKFETLKTVKKGPDLAGSQVLRDLIEEVQKLTIPEPTPSPEGPTSAPAGEAPAAEEPAVAKTAPPVEELPPATEPPVEFDPEKRIAERLEEIRQRREKEAGDNAAPVAKEPPVEASSGTLSPVTAPSTAAPSTFTPPPATEPPQAEMPAVEDQTDTPASIPVEPPAEERPGFWSRLLRRSPKPSQSPPPKNSDRVRQRRKEADQKKKVVAPKPISEAAPESAPTAVPVPPREPAPPQEQAFPAEPVLVEKARPLSSDAGLILEAKMGFLTASPKLTKIIPGEVDAYLDDFLSLLNSTTENPDRIAELLGKPIGMELLGVRGVDIKTMMLQETRDVTLPFLKMIISKARGGYPNARLIAGELLGTALDAAHEQPEHNYSTAVELMNVAETMLTGGKIFHQPDSGVILRHHDTLIFRDFMKAMEENQEMMKRLRDANDRTGITVREKDVSKSQLVVDTFTLMKTIYEEAFGFVIVEDGGSLKFKQKEPVEKESPVPKKETGTEKNKRSKNVDLPDWVKSNLKERGQGDIKLLIIQGDLLAQEVDAITNAANEQLSDGLGINGQIHHKAGSKLDEACAKLGGCKTGDAKTTDGFDLGKKIIHAVGPDWDNYTDKNEARDLLASTIKAILREARTNGFKTIAIPAISTGIFSFPADEASVIIRDTIYADLIENGQGSLKEVRLVLWEDQKYNQFDQVFSQITSPRKEASKKEVTADAAPRPTEAFISRTPGGDLFIDPWERVANGTNILEFEALGGGFRDFQKQAEYLIPKILGKRKTDRYSGDLIDAQRALYKYLIAPSEDLRVELSTEFDEIYKLMLKSDFQETDISSADFIARYRAEVVELDRLKYGVKGEDDPVDKTVGSDLLKQISKAINPRDVTDLGPIREKGLFDKFSQQFNYVIDKMFGKSDVVSYYYLRDRLIRYFMSPERRTDDGLKKALNYLKAQGIGVEENYSVVDFVAAYRQELYKIDRQMGVPLDKEIPIEAKSESVIEKPKQLTPEEAAKPWKEKFETMKKVFDNGLSKEGGFNGYKAIQDSGHVADFEQGFKIVLKRQVKNYDFSRMERANWQTLVRRFLIKAYIHPDGTSAGEAWREVFREFIQDHTTMGYEDFLEACMAEFDHLDKEASQPRKDSPRRKIRAP